MIALLYEQKMQKVKGLWPLLMKLCVGLHDTFLISDNECQNCSVSLNEPHPGMPKRNEM